ncbi:MAG TPA: hypothetical protein VM889_07240 [Candidatus Thermoplasmatota archaeon]|nr:hypothetical protein [Candidatus Thermoplasmatota archaeon]
MPKPNENRPGARNPNMPMGNPMEEREREREKGKSGKPQKNR